MNKDPGRHIPKMPPQLIHIGFGEKVIKIS